MFVNKNVKSFKNVNKTKHHRRNKNKKRSIKKLSIKAMRGGSANSGASGASGASASAIISIPTLLELIQSKYDTMCELHYDDVKIICLLGNYNVKLGYDTKHLIECILITYNNEVEEHYDAPYYNATLDYYFYTISKQDCLYSKNKLNRLIDNRVYFDKNKGNNNYSKSINTLLLELVDTINILVGVKYCQLIDDATVNCTADGSIKLSLNLKHITKGYGFYNEFGYIYTKAVFSINTSPFKQLQKYELLDLKFANFILTLIYNNRTQFISNFSDLEKQCTKTLNVHNNKDYNALHYSIQDSLKEFNEFNEFNEFRAIIIKTVTDNIVIPPDNKLEKWSRLSNLFKIFIKRYEYLTDNTVSKSELIKEKNPVQDPPQKTPYHFAMVNYTKPTITITSLQEEQPPNPDEPHNPHKPRKPVYLITITKGTKIE